MKTTRKTAKLATTMLAGFFWVGAEAFAAGLGRLTVHSSLGQPLDAEVAINATAEELPTLAARLAPPDAFKAAGIDFSPLLTSLRVTIERRERGQPLLRITTAQPINEPFLQLLLELDWSGGRVRREYTFLLDPPEMLVGARAPTVVAPVAPAAVEEPLPLGAQARPAKPGAAPETAASQIRVKAGETLAKIARQHKPASVTLEQMLVALFEANPRAFSGENMNRLRAGAILRLPDEEEIAAVDSAKARDIVIAQGADFARWKARLAAATAAMPMPTAAEEHSPLAVAGKIQPRFEEAPAPALPTQDKLEVSRTEVSKGREPSLARIEEELIARDKALREANERIAQLEKNIEGLKRLVEIKAQGAAQLQQQAEAANKGAGEAQQAAAAPAAKPVAPPTGGEPKPESAVEPLPTVEKEKAAAPSPAMATKPETADKSETAPTPAQPAVPKPAPKVEKAAPLPEEPSFFEENLPLVLGGGGIIALLLGWLGYARWRRRHTVPSPEKEAATMAAQEAAPGALEEKAPPSLIMTPSEMAPASESSRFSTLAEISDPVAEAEVLLAYGRDTQAEEILLAALSRDPTRTAVHLKLLEIYADRRDTRRFTEIALALREACQARGEDWQKALALAATLGLPAAALMPATATADETGARPSAGVAEGLQAGDGAVVATMPPSEETIAVAPIPAAAKRAETVARPTGEEAPSAVVTTTAESTPLAPAIDFLLEEEKAPATDTSASQAAPLDLVLDFATESAAATPAEEKGSTAAPMLDLDLGFAAEPSASASPAAETTGTQPAPTLDFDLSGIDLELEPPTPSKDAPAPEPAAAEPPAAGYEFDLVLPEEAEAGAADAAGESLFVRPTDELAPATESRAEADDPEVQTKLELADAYEEMGDLEGARELLNEIINEGSERQREEARARLARLAA